VPQCLEHFQFGQGDDLQLSHIRSGPIAHESAPRVIRERNTRNGRICVSGVVQAGDAVACRLDPVRALFLVVTVKGAVIIGRLSRAAQES